MIRSNFVTRIAGGLIGALVCASPLAARADLSSLPNWRFEDGSDTGSTVGTAGDFNCDGISDLLIGNESGSVSSFDQNSGWIGIWYGSPTLPPQPSDPPDWRVYGNGVNATFNDGARLGATSAAGDVNRDGCDDVIVSSRQSGGAGANIRAYFGAAGGPSTNPGWLRFLLGAGGEVESIAVGDVNGDGTADIIAGIPEANFGELDEGAVLVWMGSQFLSGTNQILGHDWIAQSNQIGAELGRSVAAGDVNGDGRDDVVAGAPLWDFVGGITYTDTGRVFMWPGSAVFESTADGTPGNAAWSHVLGSNDTRLGFSVAVPGDLDGDGDAEIVMGGPTYDNTNLPGTQEGIVVVTRGASPQPLTDLADWFHRGQVNSGQLGYAVAAAGDVNGDSRADYLIGEPGIQVGPEKRGRAILVLGRDYASWSNQLSNVAGDASISEASTFAANLTAIGRQFGARLGTAGDWNGDGFSDIVVSVQRTNSPNFGAGKAVVYLGGGNTLASAPSATIRGGQDGALLGLGVAFAGDINADGFSDIVAGAPLYESDAGQTDEGRVFVRYGAECGESCGTSEPNLLGAREGNQAGANLGWSVSGAGDVNGDGFADVIAGAPLNDGEQFICGIRPRVFCPRTDSGLAQLFLGGPSGLSTTQSGSFAGDNQANAKFGYSVAGAGDVNGDGYGDVIVGAPFGSAGLANEGRVFLYLGGPGGLSLTWSKSGGQANAQFGIDVASAGDVNGDGYGDVIIGATGAGGTGAAYIYLGRPTTPLFPQGLWNTPIRTLVGSQAASAFGITVGSAGDVNGDGFADVYVGAPEFDDDPELGPQIGAVFVYHGGAPAGPAASPSTSIFGAFPDPGSASRFGNGVAGAGDVNGDGFDDLIVGDHWHTGPAGFAQGRADVFHGSATGLAIFSSRSFIDCPTSFCDFGRDVAGQGDYNGDGFGDVLIGAYANTFDSTNEGAAFLHLGNEGRGRPVRPLQTLGFGGAIRAILGITPDNFDVSMDRRTPAGRGRVELEVEVKPLGQDFDGTGLLESGMLDNVVEPRGTVIKVGNAPNDKFHWRARLRSLSPLFGRSRWISLPENGARELDVRVVPEPAFAASLAIGLGGLAALARGRRSRARRSEREVGGV